MLYSTDVHKKEAGAAVFVPHLLSTCELGDGRICQKTCRNRSAPSLLAVPHIARVEGVNNKNGTSVTLNGRHL